MKKQTKIKHLKGINIYFRLKSSFCSDAFLNSKTQQSYFVDKSGQKPLILDFELPSFWNSNLCN